MPRIELLSLKQLLAELGEDEDTPLPKSTYYDWEAKGLAPNSFKLPNGRLRFRRTEVDRWIEQREAAAS